MKFAVFVRLNMTENEMKGADLFEVPWITDILGSLGDAHLPPPPPSTSRVHHWSSVNQQGIG